MTTPLEAIKPSPLADTGVVGAHPELFAEAAAPHERWITDATRAITIDPRRRPGTPEIGLPVLMFAGELGAAVQPGEYRDPLPASLVSACEQTVTPATVTAAASPRGGGLVDAVQALSALAS